MKQFLFFLILFIFFLPACSSSTKKNHKLTDEKLALMMLDFHMAEAILPELGKEYQDSLKELYWRKMSLVYGLSKEEIIKEIDLLESDPEKMKLILDQVKMMADSIQ